MPSYEYVCSVCRHRTEIQHGVHEAGPTVCPSCGAEGSMRKAVVVPAVHFKGSGWAKKERGSGSTTKAAAASESRRDRGAAGGSETSSEDGPKPVASSDGAE